jgi:hypothetical protein
VLELELLEELEELEELELLDDELELDELLLDDDELELDELLDVDWLSSQPGTCKLPLCVP